MSGEKHDDNYETVEMEIESNGSTPEHASEGATHPPPPLMQHDMVGKMDDVG